MAPVRSDRGHEGTAKDVHEGCGQLGAPTRLLEPGRCGRRGTQTRSHGPLRGSC
jgi:hypothetical protein